MAQNVSGYKTKNDVSSDARSEAGNDIVYRDIVQSIGDYAIFTLDLYGHVTTWNAGAERVTGYRAADALGRHYAGFLPLADDASAVAERHLGIARADGKFETQGWRVRVGNAHYWAHEVITALRDAGGTVYGFAGVIRDCTEQRRIEQRAHEEEGRFRILVEGVTDYAIYMLDPHGIVTNWNAGAQRAKGYTADEIVGQHFSVFYETADQIAGAPAAGLLTAQSAGRFEARGWRKRKNGTRFWAHVVIQPIYDRDGALFGFAKVTRDCTTERENALALETTSRNLDLALDNMLQGLCLFDRQYRLVLCNTRFLQLLGLSRAEIDEGMRLPAMLRLIGKHAFDGVAGLTRRTGSLRTVRRRLLIQSNDDGTMLSEFQLKGRHFSVSSRRLAHGGWVSTIEDVTARKAAEDHIRNLAHHDTLTGLPNRVSFHAALQQRLMIATTPLPCAILYLDLDRFKNVNDTLGHHAGDDLLRSVARRLTTQLAPGDLLARLSGDEFVVIQHQCREAAQAIALAQRCIRAVDAPFNVFGNEVALGVSIGIVVHPEPETGIELILQHVDLALYKAKREGRNCYCMYEAGMFDPLRAKNAMESDLLLALRRDEFHLHYQPIIDAATNQLAACEALLRWNHPERGNIPPGEFITIAEERGLMPVIGAWVLKTACEAAQHWPAHVRLSVNVSPAQLTTGDGAFCDTLTGILNDTGFDPCRLELEITETALLASTAGTRDMLHTIRNLGIGIAMDDFGTGYSSLSLLQSFPFTRIKIDRSFVQDLGNNPRSSPIVRCIAELCSKLGAQVVAEGVETRRQLDILMNEQCHEIQGFFISRPVSPEQLLRWMAAHTPLSAGLAHLNTISDRASAALVEPAERA